MLPITFLVTFWISFLAQLGFHFYEPKCVFATDTQAIQHCIADYHNKANIPAVIPRRHSIAKALGDPGMSMFISIYAVGKNYYSVSYNWSANCRGGMACSFANFFANKVNQAIPTDLRKKFLTFTHPFAHPVKLKGDITGFLEKFEFSGLPDSLWRTLSWEQHQTRYQLTMKGYNDQVFIRVANDVIPRINQAWEKFDEKNHTTHHHSGAQ